jgi:hypothetical protein
MSHFEWKFFNMGDVFGGGGGRNSGAKEGGVLWEDRVLKRVGLRNWDGIDRTSMG